MMSMILGCVVVLMVGTGQASWIAAVQEPRMVFAHYLIYFDDSVDTQRRFGFRRARGSMRSRSAPTTSGGGVARHLLEGGREGVVLPIFSTDGSYFGVVAQIYDRFGSLVDGSFGWENSAWNYRDGHFAGPATSPGDADSLRVSVEMGKTYMAIVSPWFFKNAVYSSCYDSASCDSNGTRDSWSGCPGQLKGDYQDYGPWLQKRAQIIANPTPLVEIVTWNDWLEGHYVAPPLSGSAAVVDVAGFPHHAYLELGKHCIRWYKTGVEPVPAKDEIYLFSFTQSRSATVPGPLCPILHADKLTDKLTDAVFVVAVLTPVPAARITLASGDATSAAMATQGVNVHGMEFRRGTQSASITRGSVAYTFTGSKSISNSGLSRYDFNVYSIFCANVQKGKCGVPENVNPQASDSAT